MISVFEVSLRPEYSDDWIVFVYAYSAEAEVQFARQGRCTKSISSVGRFNPLFWLLFFVVGIVQGIKPDKPLPSGGGQLLEAYKLGTA